MKSKAIPTRIYHGPDDEAATGVTSSSPSDPDSSDEPDTNGPDEVPNSPPSFGG